MVEFVVWIQSTAFANLIVVITELVYELQDKNLEESLDSLQSSSLSFSITQLVEEGSVCVFVYVCLCVMEKVVNVLFCKYGMWQVWYVCFHCLAVVDKTYFQEWEVSTKF